MDNGPKLHSKMVVTFMKQNGVQIYPGGKNPWVKMILVSNEDREENGYPPRSHDCQPAEIEFADSFEESQLDVERREKNSGKKRTMVMWKNALKHVWETRRIEHTQKLIDRLPKIMNAIIEVEGERTLY